LGIVAIVDKGKLVGCLSDGDLRRLLVQGKVDLDRPVQALMHSQPHCLPPTHLASEALHEMQQHRISSVFIVDEACQPVGVVGFHDLLQAGFV